MGAVPPLSAAQQRLLTATLAYVAREGWSARALSQGCQSLGISSDEGQALFPNAPSDLIVAFCARADLTMQAQIAENPPQGTTATVTAGLRLWLHSQEPWKPQVAAAGAFFAQGHARLGVACLARSVDAIWFAAQDRSADFNYYSKRILLAQAFSASLLFWLQDRSPGHSETTAFLDRRIAQSLKLGQKASRVTSLGARLLETRLPGLRRAARRAG